MELEKKKDVIGNVFGKNSLQHSAGDLGNQCIVHCRVLDIEGVGLRGGWLTVASIQTLCPALLRPSREQNTAAHTCSSSYTGISFQLRLLFLFFHTSLCIPDVAVQNFPRRYRKFIKMVVDPKKMILAPGPMCSRKGYTHMPVT